MAVTEWPPGEIFEHLRELNRQLDRLWDGTKKVLDKLPGFLEGAIVSAWNKIVELWNKLCKEIEVFFTEPGDPGRLSDASEAFSNDVQAPVSAQAGKLTETYMQVDNKWKGDAAEEYKKVLKPDAPQSSALRQYSTTVAAVSDQLNNCRWAIIGFWIALGVALVALITAIALACIGVVTIVGTVPALVYGATCILVFIGAVATAAGVAIGVMSDATTEFLTQNNGNDHLAGGKWPPSGVAAY